MVRRLQSVIGIRKTIGLRDHSEGILFKGILVSTKTFNFNLPDTHRNEETFKVKNC